MRYLMSFLLTFAAVAPITWPVDGQISPIVSHRADEQTSETGSSKLFLYSLEDMDYLHDEQTQCSIDEVGNNGAPIDPSKEPKAAPTEACRPADHKQGDKIDTMPPPPKSTAKEFPPLIPSVMSSSCSGTTCPVAKSPSPIEKAMDDLIVATKKCDTKKDSLAQARVKLKTAQDDVTRLEGEANDAKTEFSTAHVALKNLVDPALPSDTDKGVADNKLVPDTKTSAPAAVAAEEHGLRIIEVANKKGCDACDSMDPIIGRMKDKGIPVRRINSEDDGDIVRKYDIRTVPTFLLVNDNGVVSRMTPGTTTQEVLESWYTTNKGRN